MSKDKKPPRVSRMFFGEKGDDTPWVDVCYVNPKRRRELKSAHSKTDPMAAMPIPVLDSDAYEAALAAEMVSDWGNFTPKFVGGKLVYDEYEDLPTDTGGFVPFSADTLQTLWWDSERFAGAVRIHASRIMEVAVEEKKPDGDSSAELSLASG